MAYTTIDNPELYFQTVLYTGDGAANHAITLPGDEDMQPDLTWLKRRDATGSFRLFDSVRGATKEIYSDAANAESTEAQTLKSFDSDGFTMGTDAASNGSSRTYAAWNWKAGGSASSNSNGSITSSVSASTDAGFSIVSWTGNGTAGATVGHGLGVTPKMIIVKKRSGVSTWNVYDETIGNTKGLYLNTTDATTTYTGFWNDTSPTSSVFSVGADNTTNSATYIAYCFSDVKGYSKFGSYTGNGNADGTFVYTGFRPAFVMVKPTSRTGRWRIKDNKRDIDNVMDKRLSAEDSDAEGTGSTEYIDFLSNGFKARASEGQWNGDGETNIYIAFAEAPFVNSNGVPCNAR